MGSHLDAMLPAEFEQFPALSQRVQVHLHGARATPGVQVHLYRTHGTHGVHATPGVQVHLHGTHGAHGAHGERHEDAWGAWDAWGTWGAWGHMRTHGARATPEALAERRWSKQIYQERYTKNEQKMVKATIPRTNE